MTGGVKVIGLISFLTFINLIFEKFGASNKTIMTLQEKDSHYHLYR